MEETAREKLVRGTVASPRLDAIGSIGFGLSRTRMAREVRAERVSVNGHVRSNPADVLKEGDTIALEGRGAAIVQELSGPTRKGRTGVTMKRYLNPRSGTEGDE